MEQDVTVGLEAALQRILEEMSVFDRDYEDCMKPDAAPVSESLTDALGHLHSMFLRAARLTVAQVLLALEVSNAYRWCLRMNLMVGRDDTDKVEDAFEYELRDAFYRVKIAAKAL